MKVFISWSGNTSKELAKILRAWIPSVVQAAKPYCSEDDIAKGTRWAKEISKELEDSAVGIICLTIDNLEAPWIMFEAGALSKNLEHSRVCPILFGVNPINIKGPLEQFQASKFNKQEIKKVVEMINKELGKLGLHTDVLDNVFEKWWPELEDRVNKVLSKKPKEAGTVSRTERELLEDVLERVKFLTSRASGISGRRTIIGIPPRKLAGEVSELLDKFESFAAEVISNKDITIPYPLLSSVLSSIEPIVDIIPQNEIKDSLSSKLIDLMTAVKISEVSQMSPDDD